MFKETNITGDDASWDIFTPIFSDVVTLDPSRLESAWDKLSVDTQMLEVKSLNKYIAMAFFETFKETFTDSGALNEPEKNNRRKEK